MSNIDFEDEDLKEFEPGDLDIEDDVLNTKKKPIGDKGKKPSPKGAKKPVGPKGQITKKKDTQMDKKVVYSIIAGGAVVLAISAFMIFNSISAKKQAQAEALRLAEEQAASQQTTTNDVTVGIPNLYGTGSAENDSAVTDSSAILKDLNGNTVATNYTVVQSETVTDFITYTKHRAITGDGIEFYWLEAIYKNQPCKVQVPYSIYSKLDDEGITVVDAEVLTLDNGSQIVTYMSVRKDAKDLLDKNR